MVDVFRCSGFVIDSMNRGFVRQCPTVSGIFDHAIDPKPCHRRSRHCAIEGMSFELLCGISNQ
ncbi:hypothetical protein BQ8482_290127 [Mesorhizobium delmotii]|uniref:Uncharacterized protein n=1 Tax=Mesorhizobium delmotii TaxID=1631247 RepID=A0A2P9AN24_9HYPH|nr:hypothetical protein BQ8482_290127 [Mesorhizobium delmotii]